MHLSVAVVAVAAMALSLTPAVADPLADPDEYPKVAFLARNDVPFDAQTAASMAAQLGAPIFITSPDGLSDAAATGIGNLNPQVIIVAGGVFAIPEAVADAAAAQCDPDCSIDRYAGAGRDDTAAALAGIATKYGFDRPVLQGSRQVVGDVSVGGTVNADALTVQDTGLVSGLNADRVDGKHASDFLGVNDKAADSQLLDGRDDHWHPDNDGNGSGLDADTVDGSDSSDFAAAGHRHLAVFDSAMASSSESTSAVLDSDLVPDMTTTVEIPSGHTGVIVARFNLQSTCTTTSGTGDCRVQILADGAVILPAPEFTIENSADGQGGETHIVQGISGELGPGVYTVTARWRVTNSDTTFGVQGRSLTTEVKLTG